MTREEFTAKAAELAQNGIQITGDHGEADKDGVTVAYTYQNGTLTLQIMRKPVFVTLGYCEGKLKEWLA